jgi:site-specific DNA-cytosine methylase
MPVDTQDGTGSSALRSRSLTQQERPMRNSTTIDVFCGAGGLTHGFILEGFNVVAGFDADETCRFPFEHNNRGAQFICKKIEDIDPKEIVEL